MIWLFENDTGTVERKLADRSLAGIIIFSASFLLSFTMILLCNATIYGRTNFGVDNSGEVIITIVGVSYRIERKP